MKLVSWNVNGLRAVLKKDPSFTEIFADLDADVFALQETKLQEGQVDLEFDGYRAYWSYAERKGYSGTAVFTRHEPLQVLHSMGRPELGAAGEGRIVALEFPRLWFVCVYTPNAKNELLRIDERMEWDDAFREFCKGLEVGTTPAGPSTAEAKPVVMCGDFNVAHNEIDLKNPEANRGNAGFSDEERGKFDELIDAGFVDAFRDLNPDARDAYSWWSYRMRARERNVGWRIDYFLVSESLRSEVRRASIRSDIFGSDHCPITLELDEED